MPRAASSKGRRPTVRSGAVGPAPDAKGAPGGPLVRGLVPLHHQLYAALRAALELGHWPSGSQLPTEKQLGEQYGCSLITVRRALDELARERRIVRVRGKGTFAKPAPVDRELTALTSFTDEMASRGLAAHTDLLAAALRPASPAVAEKLRLAPGSPVYRLERLRHAGGEPLLLEDVQLPAAPFPGLLEADLSTGSLYDLLGARYGVELTRGEESLEPAMPRAREAELLQQSRRAPVLLLELVSYTVGDVPIEYCRTVVRGDRARYRFDANRVRSSLSLISSVRFGAGE